MLRVLETGHIKKTNALSQAEEFMQRNRISLVRLRSSSSGMRSGRNKVFGIDFLPVFCSGMICY